MHQGHTTKTLVNLYRGAIIQVFNGYMEEFQNISEKMIDSGVVDDSELEQFNKEVAAPIIDEISTQLSSKISGIKVDPIRPPQFSYGPFQYHSFCGKKSL